MQISTLAEVKKAIKDLSVDFIEVTMDAFGEGYDVHLRVTHDIRRGKFFQLGEEEKKYNAEARRKRVFASLEKLGYKVVMGAIHE